MRLEIIISLGSPPVPGYIRSGKVACKFLVAFEALQVVNLNPTQAAIKNRINQLGGR